MDDDVDIDISFTEMERLIMEQGDFFDIPDDDGSDDDGAETSFDRIDPAEKAAMLEQLRQEVAEAKERQKKLMKLAKAEKKGKSRKKSKNELVDGKSSTAVTGETRTVREVAPSGKTSTTKTTLKQTVTASQARKPPTPRVEWEDPRFRSAQPRQRQTPRGEWEDPRFRTAQPRQPSQPKVQEWEDPRFQKAKKFQERTVAAPTKPAKASDIKLQQERARQAIQARQAASGGGGQQPRPSTSGMARTRPVAATATTRRPMTAGSGGGFDDVIQSAKQLMEEAKAVVNRQGSATSQASKRQPTSARLPQGSRAPPSAQMTRRTPQPSSSQISQRQASAGRVAPPSSRMQPVPKSASSRPPQPTSSRVEVTRTVQASSHSQGPRPPQASASRLQASGGRARPPPVSASARRTPSPPTRAAAPPVQPQRPPSRVPMHASRLPVPGSRLPVQGSRLPVPGSRGHPPSRSASTRDVAARKTPTTDIRLRSSEETTDPQSGTTTITTREFTEIRGTQEPEREASPPRQSPPRSSPPRRQPSPPRPSPPRPSTPRLSPVRPSPPRQSPARQSPPRGAADGGDLVAVPVQDPSGPREILVPREVADLPYNALVSLAPGETVATLVPEPDGGEEAPWPEPDDGGNILEEEFDFDEPSGIQNDYQLTIKEKMHAQLEEKMAAYNPTDPDYYSTDQIFKRANAQNMKFFDYGDTKLNELYYRGTYDRPAKKEQPKTEEQLAVEEIKRGVQMLEKVLKEVSGVYGGLTRQDKVDLLRQRVKDLSRLPVIREQDVEPEIEEIEEIGGWVPELPPQELMDYRVDPEELRAAGELAKQWRPVEMELPELEPRTTTYARGLLPTETLDDFDQTNINDIDLDGSVEDEYFVCIPGGVEDAEPVKHDLYEFDPLFESADATEAEPEPEPVTSAMDDIGDLNAKVANLMKIIARNFEEDAETLESSIIEEAAAEEEEDDRDMINFVDDSEVVPKHDRRSRQIRAKLNMPRKYPNM